MSQYFGLDGYRAILVRFGLWGRFTNGVGETEMVEVKNARESLGAMR